MSTGPLVCCCGADSRISLPYFPFGLSLLFIKDFLAYSVSTAGNFVRRLLFCGYSDLYVKVVTGTVLLILRILISENFKKVLKHLFDISVYDAADVFSDLERSVCRMVHRQVATIAWFEADSVCGSHSVAIPIVLVLPYIFRFFQCLRQYKDTKEKSSLLNALKYSSAVPVIFLSALKYHVFPDKWTGIYRPLWLVSSVVNSLYSFYWDVTRDWDLSCFTRTFKFSKPHVLSQLLYGRKWVYLWVLGSNLTLRCTWTYKLSAHLRHNYLTVFTITALEMLRRFQWIFFRVENEWNKMNSKSSQLSMIDIPSEEEALLSSNGHNV
ncbi:SPX and EXS domain-containing protein 1-like [Dorcoceras hygrometricum]|uniref:SPX and EXS domain-containing protein 1-like n=1 Tax=Dorcoceras hygrometricum TaxID=472368 RepID=A0A2Z7AFY7_9LAMI|nr:SPX and EXS domain-containing protein 1-like [Dorcoceras hygrometricum]